MKKRDAEIRLKEGGKMVALPIITVLLVYVMFAPVKKETLGEE